VTQASTTFRPTDLTTAPPGPALTEPQRLLPVRVAERVRRGEPPRDVLEFMVAELKWHFPAYAWAGVYVTKGDVLDLGPFRGAESPHHRIRIGVEGICGWVAQHAVPQIIPDVNADPRYLSCSASIRSEIVVPIVEDGRVWGVIDIDSEMPAAFTQRDLDVLTELARVVAPAFTAAAGAERRP
jgi:L-methionine (R)-S-oxide reductase